MNTVKMMFTSLSLSLFSTLLLKVYLDIFLVKKSRSVRLVGWSLFFLWQLSINTKMVFFHPVINLMISLTTILIIGIISYEGILWKRCIFPIIFVMMWMLLEGMGEAGYVFLNNGQSPPFMFNSILAKFLLFLSVMGIRWFMNRHGGGRMPYSGGAYLTLFLLSGLVLYPVFYMLVETSDRKGTDSFGWLLMAGLILTIMNLSIYPIYLRLVETIQVKKNAHMYVKQLEYYGRQHDLEKAASAEIQEMKHDMKQRLIYLQELVKSGQKEKLLATLENLIGKSGSIGRLESKTGSLIIDAMVNHVWERTCNKGILLHTNLQVPRVMKIKDEDLGVLLGNAFDNAVEASEYVKQGKGEIWIEITHEKGYLYIFVRNRYQGKIEHNKGHRLVSRKEEAFHGWGIYSMEKIAKKYHGRMELDWEGDIFSLETILYDDI
ncbi:GHKL domain-containing protein [Lacrimispora sp. BS-2]|uniref:GHKL domain-containing protein n=1 Tax=Lacrimispora sp. BS-2 TaxID=3151850 RepID=A0AAU7PJ58_9FIRM